MYSRVRGSVTPTGWIDLVWSRCFYGPVLILSLKRNVCLGEGN